MKLHINVNTSDSFENNIIDHLYSTVVWVLKEKNDGEKSWLISNRVTEKANHLPGSQKTYMNLGTRVDAHCYHVVLLVSYPLYM